MQWSDSGVVSANKFLQKIWNINCLISNRKEKNTEEKIENKFLLDINIYVNKIDSSISDFRFNVSIAYFYEVYKYFKDYFEKNISNKVMKECIVKIMKLMIPFTPHLAHECLELFNCDTINEWPIVEKNTLTEIKLPIQINGKTRDIITIKKDLGEKQINEIIMKDSKAKKYIEKDKIIKTIFIKNKIINYIIKS